MIIEYHSHHLSARTHYIMYVQFPRIRKYAAEALYLQLLSDNHAVGRTYRETQTVLLNRAQATSSPGSGVDLEPIFCGFASTAEELERISDFIAGTAWDGDLGVSRDKRLCVCGMMQVDMQMRAPSDRGEYVRVFVRLCVRLCVC